MRASREIELASRRSNAVLKPTPIQIERELEVFGQIMDNQFRLPVLGWRFGLNAIIDLVPGFGDIATSVIALYVLVAAVRYRIPKVTLLRMGLNIGIYFVVGLVPLIGDVFAIWWKPNIRNINLLRARATVSAADAKKGRTSDWAFVAVIVGLLLTLLVGSVVVVGTVVWFILNNLRVSM
ncbi:MAG: DUF4112 domain-containing protein [Pyrinomonadaceae bacterium]